MAVGFVHEDINQHDLKDALGVPYKKTRSDKNRPKYNSGKGKAIREKSKQAFQIYLEELNMQLFKHEGLPDDITNDLLERVIFFSGKAMQFKWEGSYFFLPFTLSSKKDRTIDFYGRYMGGKPLPFTGKSEVKIITEATNRAKIFLGTMHRDLVYSKNISPKPEDQGVPFFDYTPAMTYEIVPRNILSEMLVDLKSEMLPIARQLCLKAARPDFMACQDANGVSAIQDEIRALEQGTFNGETIIPILQQLDLKIASSSNGQAYGDIFKMYESYCAIEKELLGVPNDNSFNKASHLLQAEEQNNTAGTNYILQDRLEQRIKSHELANHIFGTNQSVRINQEVAKKLDDMEKSGEIEENAQSESMDNE